MLYSVENASRLTFVSEMQSAKMAADIRKAASDAEASGDLSLVLLVTDCVVFLQPSRLSTTVPSA